MNCIFFFFGGGGFLFVFVFLFVCFLLFFLLSISDVGVCPRLEGKPVWDRSNSGDIVSHVAENCSFPFQYKNEIYSKCAYYRDSKLRCAVTPNYDLVKYFLYKL